MGKKHQAPATESSVEALRWQVGLLGVHLLELDVSQPESDGFLTSQGEHCWGQVGRHNGASRSYAACRRKRRLAETGSDVQYPMTGPNPGEVDEALVEVLSSLLPDVPVPLPAIRRHAPLATLAGLVLRWVKRRDAQDSSSRPLQKCAERTSSPARPAQVAANSQKRMCGPGQVQRLVRLWGKYLHH